MDLPPVECDAGLFDPQQDDVESLSREELIERLQHSYEVIEPYAAILDAKTVEFFNKNLWQELPTEWSASLTRLSVKELGKLMEANDELDDQLPKSLLKVRQDIQALSLERRQVSYHRLTMIHPGSLQQREEFRKVYNCASSRLPFYRNLLLYDLRRPPLSLLRYKCKAKKLAEIVVMADLCFKATLLRRVDAIVDVGAGLGHLSRCLAFFYNLNVIAIEKDPKLTEEAV